MTCSPENRKVVIRSAQNQNHFLEDDMTDNQRIMRRPEVEKTTGLSRSSIYAKMASGDFPQAIKLGSRASGSRASGWLEHEVQAWINDRIAASRGGANERP
jgi:prophage regulatory protein